MRTCIFYLVRHGESLANSNNVIGGHFDSPLTDKGRQQAKELKALFKNIHFDDAYSSDLQRAIETGEIIYGQEIKTTHRLFDLRERDFGKLEGGPRQEWEELNNNYEKNYANLLFEERLKYNYADFIESDKSLLSRFKASLRQIAKQHLGQTVLIATHGGDIRVILMWLGYVNFLTAGAFVNAGYVELTSDGQDFKIQKVVGVDKNALSTE